MYYWGSKVLGVLFVIASLRLLLDRDFASGIIGIAIGIGMFFIPKDFLNKLQGKSKEKTKNYREGLKKGKQERKLTLPTSFSKLYIRRDKDGLYYFSPSYDETAPRFEFDGYEWAGANITITSHTTGNNKTSSNIGKSALGAALGGDSGAIIGASGKRKTKVNEKTTQKETEKDTPAKLHFKNVETGEYIEKKFKNNRETDSKVKAFFR